MARSDLFFYKQYARPTDCLRNHNEARGLKIRKASEEVKGELKRLRAIERKYNKIIDFAQETKEE